MTISEMHQAKQAAEKEIAQALSKFMDSTGAWAGSTTTPS